MLINIIKESSRGYDALRAEDLFLKERKIFFTEEVTAESSKQLSQAIMHLEQENEKKEIILYMGQAE